jgi:hypothetical protein
VRTGQRRLHFEGPAIALERLLEPVQPRERDGHVLEDLEVVRLFAQRESIRRDGRVQVTGPLQRQRLVQVIEALRLEFTVGPAAEKAAPP